MGLGYGFPRLLWGQGSPWERFVLGDIAKACRELRKGFLSKGKGEDRTEVPLLLLPALIVTPCLGLQQSSCDHEKRSKVQESLILTSLSCQTSILPVCDKK